MQTQRTIAITAPFGNIGQLLLARLQEAGVAVRALSRNPQNLACSPQLSKISGSIQNPADVARLLDGADTLFWATPPDFQSPDLLAWYRQAGESAASALSTSSVRRVVHLSSLGAELGSETGLIYGHRLVEEQISEAAADVMQLRCAYFMENFLTCLMSIGDEKRICRPVAAGRAFPMVATADVARIAADVLLDESWQGRQSMDVLGPQDLSLAQAVQILSEELGEQISYEQLEGSLCLEHLTNIGLGADMARLLVRSYEWIEGGTPDYAARRDPAQSWQQDFRSFVRQTFVPIFSALH